MPVEVKILAYACLLQAVLLAVRSILVNLQLGPRYTGGNRDVNIPITGQAGRMDRSVSNHYEALILFTIAVVVVVLADKSSGVTEAAAWVFLLARILFVGAYASGIPYLRSVIWSAGLLAILTMLIVALI